MLYYRKMEKLPKKATVHYLKYAGSKGELIINPTMEDVEEMETWNADTRKKMDK